MKVKSKKSKNPFAEMKSKLSKNDDERIKQLTKLFKDTKTDIIKDGGKCCNDYKLLMTICKRLNLKYEDYLALSVSILLES